jgi:6,7-dimethyl-8-ribityllumazine synthase
MASSLKNLSVYKDTPLNLNYPRIGIVVSEWYSEVTDALASGAINTLISKGISEQDINVKYVPGTFELALGAKYMIDTVGMDAVLCLGCVIQGETRHFDFICNASANAIATLNLESGVPVIFGVLTTDNQQQALDRSGGKHGNKGVEAAMAALKMISLNNTLFDEFDQELLEEFGED